MSDESLPPNRLPLIIAALLIVVFGLIVLYVKFGKQMMEYSYTANTSPTSQNQIPNLERKNNINATEQRETVKATPQNTVTPDAPISTPTPQTRTASEIAAMVSRGFNGRVIATRANLREYPSNDGAVLEELEYDDFLKIGRQKSPNSPWFEVTNESGTTGWMHGDAIEKFDN